AHGAVVVDPYLQRLVVGCSEKAGGNTRVAVEQPCEGIENPRRELIGSEAAIGNLRCSDTAIRHGVGFHCISHRDELLPGCERSGGSDLDFQPEVAVECDCGEAGEEDGEGSVLDVDGIDSLVPLLSSIRGGVPEGEAN